MSSPGENGNSQPYIIPKSHNLKMGKYRRSSVLRDLRDVFKIDFDQFIGQFIEETKIAIQNGSQLLFISTPFFQQFLAILQHSFSQNSITQLVYQFPQHSDFSLISEQDKDNLAFILKIISECSQSIITSPDNSTPLDKYQITITHQLICFFAEQITICNVFRPPKASKVKCLLLGKPNLPNSTISWCVLGDDNKFRIYPINQPQNPTNEYDVDVFGSSEDGSKLLVCSDPSTIDVEIRVQPGWDSDLWINHAIWDNSVSYLTSLPYFATPFPDFALEAALQCIVDPSMFFVKIISNQRARSPKIDSEKFRNIVAKSLITIFASQQRVHYLLAYLASIEFNSYICDTSSLRGNTLFSSFLHVYFDTFAQNYLDDLLSSIYNIIDSIHDPIDNSSPDTGVELINALMQIIDFIVESSSLIPPEIQHLAYVLRSAAFFRFGTDMAVYNTLNGFYLLRFLNPYISNPESHHHDPKEKLFLYNEIGKLINNVGNQKPLDSNKFPTLSSLNNQLAPYYEKLKNFIMSLGSNDRNVSYPEPSKSELQNAIKDLLNCLSQPDPIKEELPKPEPQSPSKRKGKNIEEPVVKIIPPKEFTTRVNFIKVAKTETPDKNPTLLSIYMMLMDLLSK